MRRKIMLLALAAASIAMFALPAAASAQEIHWTNTAAFSGAAGAGSLTTTEEPTITCESGDVSGTPSAGGTTGSVEFDFTGCHSTIGPFTFKCRTAGSPLDNTIKTSGTYHLITTATGKPGTLVTFAKVTILCAGVSNRFVTGNVIGTITSPACGAESTTMTTSFAATGSSQNHLSYTGALFDLLSETEGSSQPRTTGLAVTYTTTQAAKGKLECT